MSSFSYAHIKKHTMLIFSRQCPKQMWRQTFDLETGGKGIFQPWWGYVVFGCSC